MPMKTVVDSCQKAAHLGREVPKWCKKQTKNINQEAWYLQAAVNKLASLWIEFTETQAVRIL